MTGARGADLADDRRARTTAACEVCGEPQCLVPTFCETCRAADRRARATARSEQPRKPMPAASTIAAFGHVRRQNDPVKLRAWLERRPGEERAALEKMADAPTRP
jgi:hypothetical protein